MNKMILKLLVYLAVIITLPACGGGGDDTPPAPFQPTTAVVTLSTQGTTTYTSGGVQATLTLPAGVTVKATQNAPQTDAGVVTSSGADLVLGIYSAASGTVSVYVAKTAGIAVGEFATVNCDIATGSFPVASDFSVSNLSAFDADGNLITGLTATFTAAIN